MLFCHYLFWQRCPEQFSSGQDYMDFALTDSVVHLNDGKREHAGIFSQMRFDVGIPSHIYYWANDTRWICVSAKTNTEMQKKD